MEFKVSYPHFFRQSSKPTSLIVDMSHISAHCIAKHSSSLTCKRSAIPLRFSDRFRALSSAYTDMQNCVCVEENQQRQLAAKVVYRYMQADEFYATYKNRNIAKETEKRIGEVVWCRTRPNSEQVS